MKMASPEIAMKSDNLTYPLGAVARLTGLSPDVLRAWERRYQVVTPLRTAGGTRRYQNPDIDRLRMLKAAVDAGNRISEMAALEPDELEQCVRPQQNAVEEKLQQVVRSLDRLDFEDAERLMSLQLAALGAGRFAREFAAPLAREIGIEWRERGLRIASEHMGTALLRSLLGASLRPSVSSAQSAPVVFCTLPGETHELGLLIAALTTLGAGGNPIYLGPDLPISEMVLAVEICRASAVALSIVYPLQPESLRLLSELREALPDRVEIWIGGEGAAQAELPKGLLHVGSLDRLEQHVALSAI
jgi:DNA-binding transcriptional MerR regulator